MTQQTCFICFESHHKLIAPCLCKSRCHQVCLQRWVNATTNISAKERCIVCLHEYNFCSKWSNFFTFKQTFFIVAFFNYFFSFISFFIFFNLPSEQKEDKDLTLTIACYAMEATFLFLAGLECMWCIIVKLKYKIVLFPVLVQQRIIRHSICIFFLFFLTLMLYPLPVFVVWSLFYLSLTLILNVVVTTSIFCSFHALEHSSRLILPYQEHDEEEEDEEINVV